MNRRTFNTLVGGGAMSMWLPAQPGTLAEREKPLVVESRPLAWPAGARRRLLVDTHVPDWDPRLLARFNASDYVAMIDAAGFQCVMQYAKSHVGLCLWQSKVGPVHANMKGRDYFGEVIAECQRRKLRTVAYYSLIYDIWAFDHHPDWRILPENGTAQFFERRPGVVCPNSPYRDQALAELRELTGNYEFDGIFLDMTFWQQPCYCAHCSERFRREHHAEIPHIADWNDRIWRKFQKARQNWILEFALLVTKTIKGVRPVTVYHQYSTIFSDWRLGIPLELRDACDYVGGDFYGGPTQYSLVCKTYYGLTRMQPFEFMTSRTTDLSDFETTKPFKELSISSSVATLHSAAYLLIDSITPDGTLKPAVYDFMGKVNAEQSPYEPFLGGDLLADVAVYFDRESVYDPEQNGLRVSEIKNIQPPHRTALIGAARILREAHIPYGVITNVNLDQLSRFRAVMVPSVVEMTQEQAAQFRKFVENGGVLYISGPSSLDRFNPTGPRFLLEDVLGLRYKGTLGSTWTYFSPQDDELQKAIWPQDALSFPGRMIEAEALPGVQVLATVTLPFVDPKAGNCFNVRFAQIWNNPPAFTPGTAPGIVIRSFGKGKVIWLAAPLESGESPVNARVVSSLLRRALPGPYQFEVETHSSVEMTLFHQPEQKRLLAGLLNMEWQLAGLKLDATVRVQLPAGRRPSAVRSLPDRKTIPFRTAAPYVEFRVAPFETLSMALVEYE